MLPTGNFADDLLFMTVRLSSTNGLGTGFFFQTKKGTVIIVSNKHFVMNEKLPAPSTPIIQTIEIVLHLDNDTNVTFKGDVEWYIHPTEDLAFFQFKPIEQLVNTKTAPAKVIYKEIQDAMILSATDLKSLTALEEVVMVGYPGGLYDEKNNLPLLRYGRTASHPSVDFNGEKRGLIDVLCIPGSSGSPVFLFNELHVSVNDEMANFGPRSLFLGVEVAMPTKIKSIRQLVKDSSNGKYLVNTDGSLITIGTDYVYTDDIGLGYYIKGSEIQGFYPQFTALGI